MSSPLQRAALPVGEGTAQEALAWADAHLNNAGLTIHSEVVRRCEQLAFELRAVVKNCERAGVSFPLGTARAAVRAHDEGVGGQLATVFDGSDVQLLAVLHAKAKAVVASSARYTDSGNMIWNSDALAIARAVLAFRRAHSI